jgi:hypothetical protein
MGLSFFYLLKVERGAVLVELIGYVVPGVLIDFKFLCDHDNGLI